MSPITESDLDRLADYAAGTLDPVDAAEVGRLIATEPAWAQAHEALVAAQPMLAEAFAGLPPEPMPAEVAARLDRALAEAMEAGPTGAPGGRLATLAGGGSRGAPDASTDGGPSNVVRLDRRRRWYRVALGTAAAVAVLAAGTAGVIALDRGATRGISSSAGSAIPPAGAKGAVRAPDEAALPTRASGADYTHDTLAQAGSPPSAGSDPWALSTAGPAHPDQAGAESGFPAQLQRLASPAALDSCLTAITSIEGGRPAGVDYARYQGQPALIVTMSGGSARVVAAGPDCGIAGADLLDSLS